MNEPEEPREPQEIGRWAPSRRGFLKSAGGLAAGGAVGEAALAAGNANLFGDGVERLKGEIELELDINGEKKKVHCEPRATLLDVLRIHLEPALTGTKLVCDNGSCGACTVHVDGKTSYACMLFAADMRNKKIRTIEGLAKNGELTPVQKAFVERDALMCGFCTPGFVMSVTACLEKNPSASLDDVKHACSGNFCRCGTYPHIFQAALDAGKALGGKAGK